MTKICGNCGNSNSGKNRFCIKCGVRLEASSYSGTNTGSELIWIADEKYNNENKTNGTDEMSLRPGFIFGSSWRVFKSIYKKLWLVALIPAITLLLFVITIKPEVFDFRNAGLLVLLIISSILANSTMFYLIDDHVSYENRQPGIKNALTKSLSRFWRVFGAVMIAVLLNTPNYIFTLLEPEYSSNKVTYYSPNSTLMIILMFLSIGAIYLLVRWFFMIPIILFQGERVIDSMQISARMVKGNFWKIIGLVLIMGLIMGGIMLALTLIAVLIEYGIFGIIRGFLLPLIIVIEWPLIISMHYFIYTVLKKRQLFNAI